MKHYINRTHILSVLTITILMINLCACTTQNDGLPRSLKSIQDEALSKDFAAASEQIGMDVSKIKDIEKGKDWAGGPLYTFTYEGHNFLLYADMNSTVKAIRQGLGTDIYSKGYEPYNVSDFIPDESVIPQLQAKAQEYVKEQLKYPAESDFSLLNWSNRRDYSLYTVASTVKAKNAFGVEEDLPFELIFDVVESSYKLVYFNIDGNFIKDDTSNYLLAERKWIGSETTKSSNGSITLNDGELGEYGKKVTLSGYEYIHYYVPIGKYEVTNNGIHGWISVDKDEITKNSSGFEETVTVMDHQFNKNGEKIQIEIKSGEHIELTASTNITLVPVQ